MHTAMQCMQESYQTSTLVSQAAYGQHGTYNGTLIMMVRVVWYILFSVNIPELVPSHPNKHTTLKAINTTAVKEYVAERYVTGN